ncbi:MAG: hypothetical protein HZB77_01450, partial [Chloroflexi bacterium]|nr:hypothetical protein [Chloroflexota bacterium]
MDDQSTPTPAPEKSAVERAIEFGVDVTLLIENLRYSPTERLRRGEKIMKSMVAFKREVDR